MVAESLPAVLPFLEHEPSPAAEDALLAALADVGPDVRRAVIELLVRRGRPQAGVELIRLFASGAAELKPLIAEHVAALHSCLRSMIASAILADRLGGIELIVFSADARSAYLLAESLRHRCGRTREASAKALQHLAIDLLMRLDRCGERDRLALNADLDELAAALAEAIRAWETHLQPVVLHTVLRLWDRCEAVVREKIADPNSRFGHAVIGALATCDPKLARAVLCCLGIPDLRAAAGQCLSRQRDRAFIEAVLNETWAVSDPVIEHGCRSVRKEHWEPDWLSAIVSQPAERAAVSLRFVAATGGSGSARIDLLRDLLGHDGRQLREAALWQLVADQTDAATQLLTAIASRDTDELAAIAGRECRRRCVGIAAPHSISVMPPAAASLDAMLREIRSTDPVHQAPTVPAENTLGSGNPHVPDAAAAGAQPLATAAAPPLERLESLHRFASNDQVVENASAVYAACNDSDPAVRARAVQLLVHLPGATAIRLLRQALHDADARVQADAIEALDAIGVEERAAWIAAKMKSADSRVRANAIRSCLRAEMYQAAEALLAMLESESAAHRASALWLVEKLGLRTVLPRVRELIEKDADSRVRARARRIVSRFKDADSATAGPDEIERSSGAIR